MKYSVRGAAALAALGTLASCGAPVPPAAPVSVKPADAAPAAKPAAPVSSEAPAKPAVPAAAKPAASVVSGAPAKPAAAQVRSATVSYEAPPGKEEVAFSVTVAPDGTITSASSQGKGAHPKSVRYQEAFAAGISGAVVGKKVSELDVRAVGGASLTTAAFVKYVRSF